MGINIGNKTYLLLDFDPWHYCKFMMASHIIFILFFLTGQIEYVPNWCPNIGNKYSMENCRNCSDFKIMVKKEYHVISVGPNPICPDFTYSLVPHRLKVSASIFLE